MEWLWLKMLGSLLLIVALIVATLWVLKRFMTFGKPQSASGISMEIAGMLHLAPRRSIYAVKTGGQVILVGVSEHGMTMLAQLPEDSFQSGAQMQPFPAAAAPSMPGASPFLSMLIERFKTNAGASGAAAFQPAKAAVSELPFASVSESRPESESLFFEPVPEESPAPVKKKRAAAASRKKAPTQS